MRFVRITNGDIMIANGHNTIPTMNSKNGGTSIESNPKESTIIQKVSITQLVSTNIIKKSIQSKNPGGILRPRRGLKLIPCVEDVVVQLLLQEVAEPFSCLPEEPVQFPDFLGLFIH